jgi:4-hydroxy-2-oxoheptanedioate aldolase
LMAPAIPPTRDSVNTLISRGVNMIILGSDMYNFQSTLKNLSGDVISQFK